MNDRVLALDLHGVTASYLDDLIDSGDLPALSALRQRSACFVLEPFAHLPGSSAPEPLRWDYLVAGLTRHENWRHGSIRFDPGTYDTWQEVARFEPFLNRLDVRSVVFDVSSCDLTPDGKVRGIVGWGVHDRGQPLSAAPPELAAALLAGPGPYPAHDIMYSAPWPSPERTRAMGEALVRGVAARTRAARWLLAEELTDWDLALVAAGETHSGAEAFWHGVDPTYPLHDQASAPAAAAAMRDLYRAYDDMIAELVDATRASSVLVFAMHGIGPNHGSGPTMFLLAELLYRWSCGRSLLQVPAEWSAASIPILDAELDGSIWSAWFPPPSRPSRGVGRAVRARIPASARRVLRGARRAWRRPSPAAAGRQVWTPTTKYRPWWPSMKAFALPSFAEGRIRVNLHGRERSGIVEPSHYTALCDDIESLLRECRDPRTGEAVVDRVDRLRGDPLALTDAEADLMITWRGMACAFDHPDFGTIGPVPWYKPGAHTGPCGFAYISGPAIAPGNYHGGSMLDVAPTLVDMVGAPPLDGLLGTSLLEQR